MVADVEKWEMVFIQSVNLDWFGKARSGEPELDFKGKKVWKKFVFSGHHASKEGVERELLEKIEAFS